MKAYAVYPLNAFKQVAGANIDKVTLEFGVKVAGEAGILYVTKGMAADMAWQLLQPIAYHDERAPVKGGTKLRLFHQG